MTTIRKRKEWIARTINEAVGTITLQAMRQVADDEKPVAVGDALVFDTTKASNAVRQYATLHGFTQRLGDATALSAGATLEEKFDAARQLVEHYESGAESWNLKASRAKVDPEAMLAQLVATLPPEKVAEIVAAAQAKLANAQG